MTVTANRQPAGTPAGGQFATSAKPESPTALTGPAPRIAMRVQQQDWVNDYAVDRGQPFTVDVTDLVGAMSAEEVAALRDNDDTSDELYRQAVDAGLLHDHRGPFYVEVEESLLEHGKATDPAAALTALASRLDADPTDLGDAVRDVTDQWASDMVNASDADVEDAQDQHYAEMDAHAASINNDGVAAQVAFLVEHTGPDATELVIRNAARSTAQR